MINRIDSNQQPKRNNAHLMLTTATGAALGTGARYIIPTKAEMTSFKSNADTFFSNAATNARGANRSILKYGGIGAIIAGGIYLVSKLFNNQKAREAQMDTVEFTKYQALLETPGYAWEYVLYDD